MPLTAANIVSAISNLRRNVAYNYSNPQNRGRIRIVNVQLPEGPITIKRWNPSKNTTEAVAREETISSQMIWRIANMLTEHVPINFDRALAGSYNTRSVLESLIAHTPGFYRCAPGRIELRASSSEIKKGHRHLMWRPGQPHAEGVICDMETDIVISELPTELMYEPITLPDTIADGEIDAETQRRHAQIQFALLMIGRQMGFRTWIAQNDRGIIIKDTAIGEMEGVVLSLADERLIMAFDAAINAGKFIDCIWFKNDKYMPAVIEIEHTTGITSGLTRMKNFQDHIPPVPTRWVISAPDEDRDKVVAECSKSMFRSLDARFFPYSAVEELYYMCHKRKIQGVSPEFLDSFLDKAVA